MKEVVTTQNVVTTCDFNMCFTFAWVGWEGGAHDSYIFVESLQMPRLNFPHPPTGLKILRLHRMVYSFFFQKKIMMHFTCKYYLVNIGYPQMKGFLDP